MANSLSVRPRMRRTARRPVRRGRGGAIRHIVLVVLLLIAVYPLVWMLAGSFKPTDEIISSSALLPVNWTLTNFSQGWAGSAGITFGTYFLNSLLIAALAVVGNILSSTVTAYALSRLEFRGRAVVAAIAIGMLLIPSEVLFIPQYVIFHGLGWVDTVLPLVVPKFLAVDAFFVFLNLQFMRGLPRELDQAAMLDGCGPFRRFWYIVLPLMKPAIATTAIFTFVWSWNDYFSQLIYLNTPSKYTLPVGLAMFVDATSNSQLGPLFAMATVCLIPLFILFVFFQRFLIQGIATSGFKG
ncbi:carbohydrate ABC transporter permease [Rathayibacter sp. CAU 1779]